jgi:alkyl sulfatase BDS1-like metallo-beta-lactamase superfamily hydrolase
MPADLADRTDFDNANRGLIARLEPGVIKNAEGRVVWDIDGYGAVTQGSARRPWTRACGGRPS